MLLRVILSPTETAKRGRKITLSEGSHETAHFLARVRDEAVRTHTHLLATHSVVIKKHFRKWRVSPLARGALKSILGVYHNPHTHAAVSFTANDSEVSVLIMPAPAHNPIPTLLEPYYRFD